MRLNPVIYEHAARCAGLTPWQASRDAAGMAQAHLSAWRIYCHAPVTVGIDLYNPEPEAFGAIVAQPPGTAVPVIPEHLLRDYAGLSALKPLDPARDGRLPLILEAVARVRQGLPADAPVAVPVQGPFSCAAGLLGMENLVMAAQDDPAVLEGGLRHLAAMLAPWVEAVAAAGAGITIFESAAAPPMLSPRLFRKVAARPLADLTATATRAGGRPPFLVVGGDIAPIIGDLAASGCGGLIIPAETDQARCLSVLADRPELRVRINLPVGAVVGSDDAAFSRALAFGCGLAEHRAGAVLGSGVLPWDADPDILSVRLGARAATA